MNFCTYFDKNYIIKFLALNNSIKKFNFNYKFYILALDDYVESFFKKNSFENIIIIKLRSLEDKYPELLAAKKNRNLIEYYFTLSPFLPKFIYEKYSIYNLSYLDSDFYFFKNPQSFIIKNSYQNSVILIKQNSNPKYGFYNMGWISYNFEYGETYKILKKWAAQCIEWCSDIPYNNKYADQKYLDKWIIDLNNIKIFGPAYSCLSPWDGNNIIQNNINSMIAFHFHGFEMKDRYFVSGFHRYNKSPTKKIISLIYYPYVKEIISLRKNYQLELGNIRNKSQKNLFIRLFRKYSSIIKRGFYMDIFRINTKNL